jgi:hypothetical protein
VTLFTAHDIEAPMNVVRTVYVDVCGRSVQYGVARRQPAESMRRRFLSGSYASVSTIRPPTPSTVKIAPISRCATRSPAPKNRSIRDWKMQGHGG